MWLFDSIRSIQLKLNGNWIVRWKLHNTFKANKRRWSVDSHLVPVVKRCPNYRILVFTLALYLTVLPSLMAAKWPYNMSDLFVLLISRDGWRCCLPEQHKVNGQKENKANEEEDDDVDVDKLKFCTQILIHKISCDVPIHLSAAPRHAIAQSEKKREQNILLCVCAHRIAKFNGVPLFDSMHIVIGSCWCCYWFYWCCFVFDFNYACKSKKRKKRAHTQSHSERKKVPFIVRCVCMAHS